MAKWFKKNTVKLRVTEGDRGRRTNLKPETKHGLTFLFLVVVSLLLLLSLANLAGPWGVKLHYGLVVWAGLMSWVIPFILLAIALAFSGPSFNLKTNHWLGLIMTLLGITGLMHSGTGEEAWSLVRQGQNGGFLGYIAFWPLYKIFGTLAARLWLVALLLGGILVLFETSLSKLLSPLLWTGRGIKSLFSSRSAKSETSVKVADAGEAVAEVAEEPLSVKKIVSLVPTFSITKNKSAAPHQEPLLKVKTSHPKIDVPIELLKSSSTKPTSGDVNVQMEKIKQALLNFGIEVEMGQVSVGPTVTQYTFKPAEGVKLSQITGLANDLALALAAHPIRIEAPIPGKALVGIEVPNEAVATVALRDILESDAFRRRRSNLTVSLGKDVAGTAWVADIETMPHLLIAGATGSGKSVCINSLLISLLYTNSPADLKFIIVDPKRVEMSAYNQIPHLLTPVITEVDKIISALKWVVAEMDRRYQILSQANKRNIQGFRQAGGDMPYIVVVIDELADLMAVAAHDVESAIIRLAQMARAVGIHLIVATQRPSVDVITGLIKANITNRIAFAVASATDSRTILDIGGAEKLLGRGDSLYLSPQLSKPKRLQCALVTDQEIEQVVNFLHHQQQPVFNHDVVAKPTYGRGVLMSEGDDLFDEAKAVVVRAQKASASLLQRRLRVGYARAARLLDLLEEAGIIGPGEGAKPREVLVDQAAYEAEVNQTWESNTDAVEKLPADDTNPDDTLDNPSATVAAEDQASDDDEDKDSNF